MKSWFRRSVPLLAALAAAAAISACDESLEGGLGCGVLCPEQPSELVQDTLLAVELDTTISGFPPIGAESDLLLASRGDTLDARAIIRFDTLPTTFRYNNSALDSNIVEVDSATLLVRISASDTLGPTITLEAYDVDTTAGDDTTAATLVPLFTSSRLLGSVVIGDDSAELKADSILIPIDEAKLLAKIQDTTGHRRLRVGLRITAAASAELRIFSCRPDVCRLSFLPSKDTSVSAVVLEPESRTPNIPFIAADLADFQILADAPPPPPPGVLRVGGVPGSRVYMRFDIPSEIIDSSTIVRAQLLLAQRPNPESAAATDTAVIQPWAISSGSVITDLRRALLFLAAGFDTARAVPADSGVRVFEVISIVRTWRGTTPELTPRAIALRSTTESATPWQVDFHSNEAPDALRPRLVITYVPRPAPRVP